MAVIRSAERRRRVYCTLLGTMRAVKLLAAAIRAMHIPPRKDIERQSLCRGHALHIRFSYPDIGSASPILRVSPTGN
ncbi:hypothetical protein BJX68DRAFT_238269 [Aspergillus pseudodeflectus]|uniref:Uncharacterized protein n=1 Tax=Aspergillus pseudodeflectus TaxID=176178 RepID=A0ABR4KBG5_9EURO